MGRDTAAIVSDALLASVFGAAPIDTAATARGATVGTTGTPDGADTEVLPPA